MKRTLNGLTLTKSDLTGQWLNDDQTVVLSPLYTGNMCSKVRGWAVNIKRTPEANTYTLFTRHSFREAHACAAEKLGGK